MTPKAKAKELFDKYIQLYMTKFQAKQSAIIAIDEIRDCDNQFFSTKLQHEYWQEVRKEIEKL